MSMVMPRVVQRPTPNYTSVAIRHDLVVLHMMEGGYEGSVVWLCNPAVKASAHLCLKADGSEVTQLVPLSMKAWAQCNFNSRGVSVEIEGFTAHGLSDLTLGAAARVAAWLCRVYAIPPVWAEGGQGRGICCHHDLGIGGGGHVDICGVGDATWVRMMAAIKAEYDAFGDGPYPEFALHGLPGPGVVAFKPDAAPAPSHGGAARAEPGDVHAHPTLSRYPAHSFADLQWKLNQLGASPPIAVDGLYGPETERALRAFQITHSLRGDGLIGPLSWDGLDAAMAA